MWAEFGKACKDCVTQNDGQTYCAFRIAGCATIFSSLPVFLGCVIYSVVHSKPFDMVGFGGAIGAILSGAALLAGGVAIKSRTEGGCNDGQ